MIMHDYTLVHSICCLYYTIYDNLYDGTELRRLAWSAGEEKYFGVQLKWGQNCMQ